MVTVSLAMSSRENQGLGAHICCIGGVVVKRRVKQRNVFEKVPALDRELCKS